MRDMIRRLTGRTLWERGLLLVGLLGVLGPLGAVERTLEIQAPATVAVGQPLEVSITASTDAGSGEQVGFLQVEMSVDGGKTWTAICYLEKKGPQVTQPATIEPGPAGSTVKLRARAAFRDGLAGDVDYNGAALRWHASWDKWQTPPAKHATVTVSAR